MPPESITAGTSEIDLNAVRRFVEAVPSVWQLLTLPAVSDHELLLRAEMRRTIEELAATLDEAARGERENVRAVVYRATALVAADLAAAPPVLAETPVTQDH